LGLGRAPGTDQFTAAALKEMIMPAMEFLGNVKNCNCIFHKLIKRVVFVLYLGRVGEFPYTS
jgi:hypothetical protein